jgi:hypothetical protein
VKVQLAQGLVGSGTACEPRQTLALSSPIFGFGAVQILNYRGIESHQLFSCLVKKKWQQKGKREGHSITYPLTVFSVKPTGPTSEKAI